MTFAERMALAKAGKYPIPARRACKCGSGNVSEPFEMDGYAVGEYHESGLHWFFCRDCGRTNRA
jgi:hypothetical protein